MPTVTLNSPANGSTVSSYTEFEWVYDGTDTSEGMKYYRLYVSGNLRLESGPYVGGIEEFTGGFPAGIFGTLTPWASYTWRIEVMSHASDPNYSYVSETRSFTKSGVSFPPIKPSNPTPANASGPGIDFSGYQLSWQDGGGADTYDVYIGPSGSLTSVSEEQVGTSYTTDNDELVSIFGSDPVNQTIYWRVDATNDYGTTTGDVWSFDPRPGKTSNPDPSDTETEVNLSSGFSWDAGAEADTYDVYIDLGDGFEVAVEGISDTAVSSLLQYVAINYGGDYSWRVDSTNTFGTTTGDTWTFTSIVIKTPLPDYEIIDGGSGPLDGGVEGTDFRWLGTNTLFTVRRMILAARDRIFIEEY